MVHHERAVARRGVLRSLGSAGVDFLGECFGGDGGSRDGTVGGDGDMPQ